MTLQHFIDRNLNKLEVMLLAQLEKLTAYMQARGGLVAVAQSWGGVLGSVLAKTLVTLIIWAAILISFVLLLVANLGVVIFQFAQPKVQSWLESHMAISLKDMYQMGMTQNLNKNGKVARPENLIKKLDE